MTIYVFLERNFLSGELVEKTPESRLLFVSLGLFFLSMASVLVESKVS